MIIMKRGMKWRISAAILVIATTFLIPGCSAGDASQTLDNGAEQFSAGKEEKDVAMRSGDEMLDLLIHDFSAAHENPQGTQLSEDDAEKKKKDSEQGQSIITSDDVSSRQEFKEQFHQLLDETKTTMNLHLTGNYVPDANDLTKMFIELEDEDAYDVICVNAYSWGITRNNMLTLSVEYDLPEKKLKQIKKDTRKLVSKAASQLPADSSEPYDIIAAVNDYLCDTVTYPAAEPYEEITHTAYGALKNGSAVCDGYSRAAKLLLNEAGVDCHMEVGETQGGGHAWNLVRLEGNWYQLDVTWNDAGSEYGEDTRRDYFLVTDDFMKQSRIWDESMWPKSADTAYSVQ